jgi:hypothetical protein
MKKKIPLNVIHKIETALKDVSHLIGVCYEKDSMVVLKEKTYPQSDFFFRIENEGIGKDKKTIYSINYLPSNEDNLQPLKKEITADILLSHLQRWVSMVAEFNKKSNVFDDPILESYYNEFEVKFIVKDADADTAPYPHEAQKRLHALYEKIKSLVKEEKHIDDSEDAEIIIKQIEVAQRRIGKQTKREVSKNLQMILAMVKKYSFRIAEMIIEGLIGAGISNLLTGG